MPFHALGDAEQSFQWHALEKAGDQDCHYQKLYHQQAFQEYTG